MPTKIRVLNDQTINEIAAGEVIENPSSIVKELVENSIDAGAKNITIEIRGGGRQLVRITDDGCGMNPDDALLCLERHATSKIRSSDDIFSVATLGFRGEAVPSIAAISKFTLLTRPEECEQGTLVIVDGGKLLSTGPAARAVGTTFEIKNLFFNVPVRKKFQRSPAYDAQEIERICICFAMAHPHIHFHLISNEETFLKTTSAGEEEPLGFRIKTLLGNETWDLMRHINAEQDGFKIEGYVGLPTLHRPNRTGQFLFINGRTVIAPLVSHTVKEAYGTMLPSNRHPVFVLSLSVPPGNVDVNVHPQKREVRFSAGCCLRELLQVALNPVLHPNSSFNETETPVVQTPSIWSKPLWEITQDDPTPATPTPPPSQPRILPWDNVEIPTEQKTTPIAQQASLPLPSTLEKKPLPRLLASLPGYLMLDGSSLHNTPLQPFHKMEECAFSLLDQRRAHQRIVYEQIARAKEQTCPSQQLLIPYTLHLSLIESQLLQNHLETLSAAGLDIRLIGPQSWSVDALPAVIANVDVPRFIDSLLESLRHTNDGSALILAEKFAHAAVTTSISYSRKLSHEEGLALIQQLCQCAQPLHCPQGKSVLSTMTHHELQKRFNA